MSGFFLHRPLAALFTLPRGKVTIFFASLTLALAAAFDWFNVPSSLLSSVAPGGGIHIEYYRSSVDLPFRVLSALFALTAMGAVFFSRLGLSSFRRPVWVFFIITLTLPYLINQWDPEAYTDTRQLYGQMERAIHDMEVAMKRQQLQWYQWQTIRPVALLNDASLAADFSDHWALELFAPSRQTDLVNTIYGANNPFLNIVGKGWIFAIIGAVILLLGLYLQENKANQRLRQDLLFFLLTFFSVISLLLAPRLIGEAYLSQGQQLAARGYKSQALTQMRNSIFWKPSVAYQMRFWSELGKITSEIGCERCVETLIMRAYKHVSARQYAAALDLLQQIPAQHPDLPGLAFWLGALYSNLGGHLCNAGQYSQAEKAWQQALYYLPTDAMAWHGLTLLRYKRQDFQAAIISLNAIVRIQQHLTFKRLTVTGQAYLSQAWAAFQAGDLAQAHVYYSTYLSPENW